MRHVWENNSKATPIRKKRMLLEAAPGGSGPAHVLMGSREPRGLKVQPEGLGLDLQTVEAQAAVCGGRGKPPPVGPSGLSTGC